MSDVETNETTLGRTHRGNRMRACAREVTRVNTGHARYNEEEKSVIVPSSGACEAHKSRISPGLPVSRETFARPRAIKRRHSSALISVARGPAGDIILRTASAAGVCWLLDVGNSNASSERNAV
jgi:hypothetical protein